MADTNSKLRIAPNEMYALAERLQGRATSIIFKDMPDTARDMDTAARLLKHALEHCLIVEGITLE